MKKLMKGSLYFIKNGFDFLFFLIRLLTVKFYRTPLTKTNSGAVAVLANGPSLKAQLVDLVDPVENKYNNYIVLNYFAIDDNFFLLKPRHYCLADPMFFQSSHRETDVKNLFSISLYVKPNGINFPLGI